MGIVTLILLAAAGFLLLRSRPPVDEFRPRWMWLMTLLALGAGAGLGIGSCLYFLLLWTGLASRLTVLLVDLALLAGATALWWRTRNRQVPQHPLNASAVTSIWILRAAAALIFVVLCSGWWISTVASPHGDWDAFSIWNLRAKFLASGNQAWRHAVSPALSAPHLGAAHPDYPLLLPALVGQSWLLSGAADTTTPAAVGLIYAVLLLLLAAGAAASFANEATGWVAFVLIAASESFASQVASQSADVPLAFYSLAVVFLLAGAPAKDWPRALLLWAGAFAALAAWTKNEGIVFALLATLWCAWRGRLRAAGCFLAGAAPALALVACLKLLLAPATVGLFPATLTEALHKLADPQRWWLVLTFYARTAWEIGSWWAHPFVLAALWLWAHPPKDRRPAWVAALPLAMLGADFLVYLLSVADLRWHLSTSVNRLWLQMWPSLLISLLILARAPDREKPVAAGLRSARGVPSRRKSRR